MSWGRAEGNDATRYTDWRRPDPVEDLGLVVGKRNAFRGHPLRCHRHHSVGSLGELIGTFYLEYS